MKIAILVFAAVGSAILGFQAGGVREPQRGGPPGVFDTKVPPSSINVIAGAPTSHSVLLSVLSRSDQKFTIVAWGDGGELKVTGELTGGKPKVVELKGLMPNNRYKYTVTTGESQIAGSFMTARKEDASFVFDVQADSHLDENTSTDVYANTLNNIVADKPDFLIDLGDTFMVDKYSQYLDSEKQYQAQRYWFSRLGSQMSVFLCLGNHDGETGWKQRGGDVTEWAREQRQKYFPTVVANDFYSGAPEKGLYYSWTWGNSLFVVLDPFVATSRKPKSEDEGWNWTLGKGQFAWLEQSLKNSNAKYKFLFIHHLVGGFGKEARGGVEASDRFEWGSDAEFPSKRTGWAEPIHTLMKRYRVNAIFHGHDHLYVRQERDGIVYMEVPQPSSSHENTRSAEEYGYKTGKLLSSPGHLRISVEKSGVKYEYVKSRLAGQNREVVDSFEQKK